MIFTKVKLCTVLLFLLVFTEIGGQETGTNSNGSDQETGQGPVHQQSAQCTIMAGEIQASAQATLSHKLIGACESIQMMKAFELLESRLMREITSMHANLFAMINGKSPIYPYNNPYFNPSYYQHQMLPNSYREILKEPSTIQTIPPPTMTPLKPLIITKGPEAPEIVTSTATTTERPKESPQSLLKSMEPKRPLREAEVQRLNNTILSGVDVNIFSYYWRITNLVEKFRSNESAIFSPVFSIGGHNLKIKALLDYLGRDFIFFQLETVKDESLKNSSSVISLTSSMFKEIEPKKKFNYKLVILNQYLKSNDLVSQEFHDTTDGYPVPKSVVSTKPYLKDDAILLKVFINL